MAVDTKSRGLICPNCGGVVPVQEGTRIVLCPFCNLRSLVKGDRGISRWQVASRIERETAQDAVSGFFTGMSKAPDLKQKATIEELFLVYLPYWRVSAFVAGWMFGRVKSGKDSTKPSEVEVMEQMSWSDAATDVSEFGVHSVSVPDDELEPYDAEKLHAGAMVFSPVESFTDAYEEAKLHFIHRGRQKKSLKQKFFEKFHILRSKLSIVYYPLWVARYEYRKRHYQVVVDGLNGTILYGKAPGNKLYRAAMLVAGMSLGNLILINGTILAGLAMSGSDDGDSLLLLLLPLGAGIGLIVAGYRKFRYGEEVETIDRSARKAPLAGKETSGGLLSTAFRLFEESSSLKLPRM